MAKKRRKMRKTTLRKVKPVLTAIKKFGQILGETAAVSEKESKRAAKQAGKAIETTAEAIEKRIKKSC